MGIKTKILSSVLVVSILTPITVQSLGNRDLIAISNDFSGESGTPNTSKSKANNFLRSLFENKDIQLTATTDPKENYIKLDWTKPIIDQEYSYRIYQRNASDGSEFETIPAKDTVKVLNIYPDRNNDGTGVIRNTGLSGGQIDLEGKTVPDSGILKTWLLKEEIDSVTIDTIGLQDFNANPEKYLSKSNGKWNYDAIYYGMWNMSAPSMYPVDNSVSTIKKLH